MAVPAVSTPNPAAHRADPLAIVRTIKLASLVLLGVAIGAAAVLLGYSLRQLATEFDAALPVATTILATTPWLGALLALPITACGVLGLLDRRRAWWWALLGSFAMAVSVVGLAVLFATTMAAVYGA
jgi:hypothetical protein